MVVSDKNQSVLTHFNASDDTAINEQLAEFLKEAIMRGDFTGGEKLPSLRTISQVCNINYFSAQLATEVLMRDGLLYKVHGKGMYVSDSRHKGDVVCLFIAEDPRGGSAFIYTLASMLSRQLCERGIESLIYNENRPIGERTTIPPYIASLINGNRLSAILGVGLSIDCLEWFDRLPIPKAKNEIIPSISFECLRHALLSDKYRHPLFIIPEDVHRGFESGLVMKSLTRAGVPIERCEFNLLRENKVGVCSFAEQGYDLIKTAFQRPQAPDLLFVYPDMAMPGVIPALIELGIDIPGKLKVFSHRNTEIPIFCPFEVTYLEVCINDYANNIINALYEPKNR